MANATITIIGLGKIGSSIGLALKAPELDYEVTGHDKDSLVTKKARERGAVDSTSWNLITACRSADVIMLAIPFDQVKATLQSIGSELRSNSVVIDTSFLKQPAIEWAKEYLAEDVHFVGISLGTNPKFAMDSTRGPDGARADLFADSPCSLMPAPDCQPAAVKAAQDLATLLGASPYFLDPIEFDGLSTAVNLIPGLLSTALLGLTIDAPSWREMRRLASSDLALFSSPLETAGPSLALAAVLSKKNVLHWLGAVMAELGSLVEKIDQEQEDILTSQIEAIYLAREKWMVDWERDRWEKSSSQAMPTTGSFFGQLFGFSGRRRKDSEDR